MNQGNLNEPARGGLKLHSILSLDVNLDFNFNIDFRTV